MSYRHHSAFGGVLVVAFLAFLSFMFFAMARKARHDEESKKKAP